MPDFGITKWSQVGTLPVHSHELNIANVLLGIPLSRLREDSRTLAGLAQTWCSCESQPRKGQVKRAESAEARGKFAFDSLGASPKQAASTTASGCGTAVYNTRSKRGGSVLLQKTIG